MKRSGLLAAALLMTGCGLMDPGGGLECQRMPLGGGELRQGEDPLGPDGPLAGLDVETMTAGAIGARAEEAGLGVTYRYSYDVGPQPESGSTGYSECWCIPPPQSPVSAVTYDSIGRIVVMVEGPARDSVRAQPERGWGCQEDSASG
jgi:hypothetical protein